MNDATFEILDRAKALVEDGERDPYDAISEAFDTEVEKEWVCWELMKDVYNPDELLRGEVGGGVVDGYAPLFDYVYNEIHTDVEDFIEEHTWRIFYCDSPDGSSFDDCDELDNKDEFLEVVEYMTDKGWKVVKREEREAWLYEPEED